MPNITLSVTDELKREMDSMPELNWSESVREFLSEKVKRAALLKKLDKMLEVFKKYPGFRMDIYPSRRTFMVPKYVLDWRGRAQGPAISRISMHDSGVMMPG